MGRPPVVAREAVGDRIAAAAAAAAAAAVAGPDRVVLIQEPSGGEVLSDVVTGAAGVTGCLRGALEGRIVADRVTPVASAAAAAAAADRRAV
jgi:hypothetical protein